MGVLSRADAALWRARLDADAGSQDQERGGARQSVSQADGHTSLAPGAARLPAWATRPDFQRILRRPLRGAAAACANRGGLLRFHVNVPYRLHAHGPMAPRHRGWDDLGGYDGADAKADRTRSGGRCAAARVLAAASYARADKARRRSSASAGQIRR